MRLSYPAYFFLSFGLFAAFILTLVFKTMSINNELVTEDYYQQELRYQSTLDKMKHSAALTHEWQDSGLVLTFPASDTSSIKGIIEFYRPSDASKDFKIPIQLTEGKQTFLKPMFTKGLYKMKVDWTEDGTAHYFEEDIYLK